MDRLQNAVPVAKGPGFLQLSVQLQGVLQPKIPSQKALYHNIKRNAKTVSDFLRPLLGRNQYCNEGCKKRATVHVEYFEATIRFCYPQVLLLTSSEEPTERSSTHHKSSYRSW